MATSGADDIVYIYDAGGQRVAQLKVSALTTSATPQSATVYLGATQVTDPHTDTTGALDATRFYTFGGATVATATSTAGATPVWSLLLGDIQGSAQVMMDLVPDAGQDNGFEPASTSHTVTRDAYLPYGATRGTSDLTVDRGWLGQVEDTSTGLTYLNARYYDPLLGRFLSPDPLMNPGDPRTLDPYRYADNNPIVFMDASGLNPSCVGKTGKAADVCWASYAVTKTSGTLKSGYQYILDNARGAQPTAGCRSAATCNKIKMNNIGLVGGRVAIGEAIGLAIVRGAAQSEATYAPGNRQYQSGASRVANGALNWLVLDDYQDCHNNGSAAGCAFYYSNFIPGGKANIAFKFFRHGDEAAEVAEQVARKSDEMCSFAGDVEVLMADGSTKPIRDVEIGDEVWALDPETSKAGPRTVTHTWLHSDALVNLAIGDSTVTTTSDHPFWNATDQQWQGAGTLGAGDMVLTATGELIPVGGLVEGSWHFGQAYNLTVDDIHTYFVTVAGASVLVHNTCEPVFFDDQAVNKIRDTHMPGGQNVDSTKSTFNANVDLDHLTACANAVSCAPHPDMPGWTVRTADAHRIIGSSGGTSTTWFTVIQDNYGAVRSAYPIPNPGG